MARALTAGTPTVSASTTRTVPFGRRRQWWGLALKSLALLPVVQGWTQPLAPPVGGHLRLFSHVGLDSGNQPPSSSSELVSSASTTDDKMHSYHSNIRRVQKLMAEQQEAGQGGVSQALAKAPVHSLVQFLEESASPLAVDDGDEHQLFSRTVIQAIRLCSSLNDYRLLLRLLDAALATNNMILQPNVLSEAVLGLGRTSASLAKIRKFWRRAVAQMPAAAVTAPQVHAMLTVLGQRGKPGAAVQLLQSQMGTMAAASPSATLVDARCVSLVLHILRDSIGNKNAQDHQEGTSGGTSHFEGHEDSSSSSSSWISPCCWQWNHGRALLDHALMLVTEEDVNNKNLFGLWWNNHAVSALLQLNARAFEAHPRQHPGPELALQLWQVVRDCGAGGFSPDSVTCTQLLSCLDKEWRVALQVLRSMQDPTNEWYPAPTVHAYAATMACCARAREYTMAKELLHEVRRQGYEEESGRVQADSCRNTLQPNTVVYNSVLQSLKGPTNSAILGVSGSRRRRKIGQKQKRDALLRLATMFELLDNMERDHQHRSWSTSPDRVTFNTVLAISANTANLLSFADQNYDEQLWEELAEEHSQWFSYRLAAWDPRERLVHTVLDQMEEAAIERDENTYRQALLSIGTVDSEDFLPVVRLVGRMLRDPAVAVTTELFNVAISVLAHRGDVEGVQLLVGRMQKQNCRPNPQTTSHVIHAMARSGSKAPTSSPAEKETTSAALPVFMLALSGNADAARHLFQHHRIDFSVDIFPPLNADHYSEAIAALLMAHDFAAARRIVHIMQDKEVEYSDRALELIGRTHAWLASDSVAASQRIEEQDAAGLLPSSPHRQKRAVAARAHAESAYAILRRIDEPSTSLLSITAKSCAAAGMFSQAQRVLRRIHRRMTTEAGARTFIVQTDKMTAFRNIQESSKDSTSAIRGLHRSILRSCAAQGNVTAALWFAEDIQKFDRQLAWGMVAEVPVDDPDQRKTVGGGDNHLEEGIALVGLPAVASEHSVGMLMPEWKALLVAASKSGHWRVCLTTLQFLRPYVEATRPPTQQGESDSGGYREYRKLASALTHAIRCMAVRSQYGWIIRSIDDWIEWSGRRPPRRAMAAAFRILSARGRGEEVHSLLTRCLEPSPSDPSRDGVAFEESLHISAITALHKAGIYGKADDVFAAAVSRGILPLSLERKQPDDCFTLDLHGMNVAVATSAVRVALQQQLRSSGDRQGEMIIVTGRGTRSALQMRPVLRPEVQRMLVEEFYPPLGTTSVPGNMGALRVSADDIAKWLSHQRQQKGARMLTVASVLRDLSSGSKLRAAFTKAASAGILSAPDSAPKMPRNDTCEDEDQL